MDERKFNAITPTAISDYCQTHTSPANSVLRDLYQKSYDTGQIKMVSGEYLGRFLSMMSKLIKPQFILEIGTFTGYGTICLAEGLSPEGKIFTIEKNKDLESYALDSFKKLKINHQVVQIIGDATDLIESLDIVFDLVFIDAAKRQYINYYELVLPKLKPGGVILADNTLWKGTVVEESTDKLGEGLMLFNEYVAKDIRVDNILLPIDDGVHFITKR